MESERLLPRPTINNIREGFVTAIAEVGYTFDAVGDSFVIYCDGAEVISFDIEQDCEGGYLRIVSEYTTREDFMKAHKLIWHWDEVARRDYNVGTRMLSITCPDADGWRGRYGTN